MKQYKLMQVALLAILLFGWAGCSQNEEEVPGNVRNGIVLNVTDTGIRHDLYTRRPDWTVRRERRCDIGRNQ